MWANHGHGPLWIAFADDEWGRAGEVAGVFRAEVDADPPGALLEKGNFYVPLQIVAGADKDRVIDDAVRQLRAIDARLKASSLAPL